MSKVIHTLVSGEALKKHPDNPRTISEEQYSILKASIKTNRDYFKARPIIVSDRTGELVIIAGNMRYEVAMELGISEIPVAIISGLTEEREREIMIRDNVSNGKWDYDELANNWSSAILQNWGIDHIPWEVDEEHDPKIGSADVSEEDVKRRAKELAQEMVREMALKDITCPNCGHEFKIDEQ